MRLIFTLLLFFFSAASFADDPALVQLCTYTDPADESRVGSGSSPAEACTDFCSSIQGLGGESYTCFAAGSGCGWENSRGQIGSRGGMFCELVEEGGPDDPNGGEGNGGNNGGGGPDGGGEEGGGEEDGGEDGEEGEFEPGSGPQEGDAGPDDPNADTDGDGFNNYEDLTPYGEYEDADNDGHEDNVARPTSCFCGFSSAYNPNINEWTCVHTGSQKNCSAEEVCTDPDISGCSPDLQIGELVDYEEIKDNKSKDVIKREVKEVVEPDGDKTKIEKTTKEKSDGSKKETIKTTRLDKQTGKQTSSVVVSEYDRNGNLKGTSVVSTSIKGGSSDSNGSGTGEDEFGTDDVSVYGGVNCQSEPVCNGDPVNCGILEQQWKARCNIDDLVTDILDCNSFNCSGDPMQCAKLQLDHERTCSTAKVQEDLVAYFDSQGLRSSDSYQEGEILGQFVDTEADTEIEGIIGGVGDISSQSGSCPSDILVSQSSSLMTVEFNLPFSHLCDFAANIRPLLIFIGYFIAIAQVAFTLRSTS